MRYRYFLLGIISIICVQISSGQSGYTKRDSLFMPTEVPTSSLHDAAYEMGSEFNVLTDGYLTKARLYTNSNEAGVHVIRIWRTTTDEDFLIAGPISWTITAGTQGWKEYEFSEPVPVSAGSTYVISISNGPDYYYMFTPNFTPTEPTAYIEYTRGLYTKIAGYMPSKAYNGNCYFRDIVFATANSAPPISAGTIGSNQYICYGASPSELTQITPPSGGSGYTYQWQNSPDGVTWSDISGATTSTYIPPALTISTYYRRLVTSGADVAKTNVILITVNAQYTLAQLHDDASIVTGNAVGFNVAITGGTPPYTVSYTINGTPQTQIEDYLSETTISTGTLTTGTYTIALTSVTDLFGCSPSSLGTNITITVTAASPAYTPVDSLFRNETPAAFMHDLRYEMGSEFQALADGYLTKARLYTAQNEGGDHIVRMWVKNGSSYTLLAGPFTWSITSGTQGWREFPFPTAIAVSTGKTYIISITNGTDLYYARSLNFTSSANGDFVRYTRSLYSKTLGTVPSRVYNSSCYFRDVVFAVPEEDNPLLPGSIGTAQSVCYNTVPAALTQITAPSGGSGGYTFQWQSSSDGINWSDIASAVYSGYSPGALTATTYFRREVTSGELDPVYSNAVQITVYNVVSSAQLHDNTTIVNNSSANFFVTITGGASPYTLNYTRNGVAQTAITGYVSGTNISTGTLTSGNYTYLLTSVTDANGCAAQNLGTGIVVNVLSTSSLYTPLDSLYRAEVPAAFFNDLRYEIGTEFQAIIKGYITKARLYTGLNEGGEHTIRLWAKTSTGYSLLAGPFTWNITSGVQGWREYIFTDPVAVTAGSTYIISISNGPDFYYARTLNFTSSAPGQYVRYVRGLYSKTLGTVPTRVYNASCYFRDVVLSVAPPTPGAIGSNQGICYNSVPATLTQVTAPTDGTGNYSYQWQSSPDGSTWSDISGATSSTYTPGALTANTYYRRRLTSGTFDPVYSNSVLISVSTPFQAQLYGSATIENNATTNFNIVLTGGVSPYTINYTRNGVAQTPVTNYVSGASISTGALYAGLYTYALTSVVDANGCLASNLGTSINIEATVLNTYHYNFTYPDRASMLAAGWDFIARTHNYYEARNTEVTSGAVVSYDQVAHPGVIRIPVDAGDLYGSADNSMNTIFRDLPSNWSSIRLLISSFNPTQNWQQAGLLVYQSDGVYVQVCREYAYTNKIAFVKEYLGSASSVREVNETATSNIYLRLDRDVMSDTIRSYYSTNGTDWTYLDKEYNLWSNVTGKTPRLAIFTGSSPSGYPNADIGWTEIITESADELRCYPNHEGMVFKAVQGHTTTDTHTLHISTTRSRSIAWTLSSDQSWLSASSTSGYTIIGDSTITISVNTSGMSVGLHTANLTLDSYQSIADPIVIPVTVIVNPDVPVTATTWKDGKSGAMSVSVDDSAPSGFDLLQAQGFSGTYVLLGAVAPSFFTDYYNAGMELGSHLVTHNCGPFNENVLRHTEIEPNIAGIVNYTPQPAADLITLVWPCGYTNYLEQTIASDYYLSARGYTMNLMEEATPENFMNLKCFNSHGTSPEPPAIYTTLVDQAIAQKKWFNLVLHYTNEDDGAIAYAATKDIWVANIGTVTKYILQRDRLILNDYATTTNSISFDVSRLAIVSSPIRSFETAFHSYDITTLQVDVDDSRIITDVTVGGVSNTFTTKTIDGNKYLLTNVYVQPGIEKTVVINYLDQSVPLLSLSPSTVKFITNVGVNASNKTVALTTNIQTAGWSASVTDGSWLSVNPTSGTGDATITLIPNVSALAVGNYTNTITFTMPGAYNTPQTVTVNLTVLPEGYTEYDFTYANKTELNAAGWSFIARTPTGSSRDTEQSTGAVVSYDQASHPGTLIIPADIGDLWASGSGTNNTRNSLFRDLPSNWSSVRLLITSFNPTVSYQQAGLVVYENDDWYVQISRIYSYGNYMTFAREQMGGASTVSSTSVTATTNLYYRLDRSGTTITAYYSLDGTTWNSMGSTDQGFSYPRLGIIVGSSPNGYPNAYIAWAQVVVSGSKSLLIGSDNDLQPKNIKLYQNFPNPFSEYTWIEYDLDEDTNVSLEVYNSMGSKVETIVNSKMNAGRHRLLWTPVNYNPGTYFITLTTSTSREVIKATISR